MAIENANITAAAIEATEFPELIRRYAVNGVPKTVVDDTVEIVGAYPEDTFVAEALSGRSPARPEGAGD